MIQSNPVVVHVPFGEWCRNNVHRAVGLRKRTLESSKSGTEALLHWQQGWTWHDERTSLCVYLIVLTRNGFSWIRYFHVIQLRLVQLQCLTQNLRDSIPRVWACEIAWFSILDIWDIIHLLNMIVLCKHSNLMCHQCVNYHFPLANLILCYVFILMT